MTEQLSRRAALAMAAASTAAFATPAWAVGAIKHYILVDLKPGTDQLVLDRWYMTFHAPQVRRAFKAWQRNYVSFRSYLPPEEARKAYPLQYGRMTEIQFDTLADFQESRPNNIYAGGLGSFTPPPGGWANAGFESTTATLPVNPQQVFVAKDTPPKETPYLRWIVFFRYPKGVTAETGDAWYRDVHAKEVGKLPGLRRYALYSAVSPGLDLSPRRRDVVRRLCRLEGCVPANPEVHAAAVGWGRASRRVDLDVHRREPRRRLRQRQAVHSLTISRWPRPWPAAVG